jgi:hypothetical protein
MTCGEPYESSEETDVRLPFCGMDCRRWHKMTPDEREIERDGRNTKGEPDLVEFMSRAVGFDMGPDRGELS